MLRYNLLFWLVYLWMSSPIITFLAGLQAERRLIAAWHLGFSNCGACKLMDSSTGRWAAVLGSRCGPRPRSWLLHLFPKSATHIPNLVSGAALSAVLWPCSNAFAYGCLWKVSEEQCAMCKRCHFWPIEACSSEPSPSTRPPHQIHTMSIHRMP